MVSWEVRPKGKHTVDVISPAVKYTFSAKGKSMSLKVIKDDRVVEESSFQHSGHGLIVDATDSTGSRVHLVIAPTKGTTTTDGTVNGEKFTVKTASSEHVIALIQELRQRKPPKARYTRLFANRLRERAEFLAEIKRQTGFGGIAALANGVIAACAVACGLCAVFPIHCLWCIACVEEI